MAPAAAMMSGPGGEADPALLLPLLLGLARSTGRPQKNKGEKEGSGDKKESEQEAEREAAAKAAAEAAKKDALKQEVLALPFPLRLHRLLSTSTHARILQWAPHGRAWKIVDEGSFASLTAEYFPEGRSHCKSAEGGKEEGKVELEEVVADEARAAFDVELKRWGFRVYGKEGPDKGSHYHASFLRGREELAEGMTREEKGADEDVDMEDAGAAKGAEGKDNAAETGAAAAAEEEPSEEVTNFLAFTGTADARVARTYLEMAGNDLETAVGLFMDHGGNAGALGLGLAASLEGSAASLEGAGVNEGGTEKSNEGEEEPDFAAMEPLPPLPFEMKKEELRDPTPAEAMVAAALDEYRAHATLRTALLGWVHRRRPARKLAGRAPPGPTAASLNAPMWLTTPTAPTGAPIDLHRGLAHPLYRSMLHSSLPVRRAAGRTIIQNLHNLERRRKLNGGNGRNMGPTASLREALTAMLHGVLFGEPPYRQSLPPTHSSIPPTAGLMPRNKAQAEGGDPALQLGGMLLSLIGEGGFANVLVGEEVRALQRLRGPGGPGSTGSVGGASSSLIAASGGEAVVARATLEELSTNGIESFVAAGGLRWACGSLVRLVCLLVRGTSSPSAPGTGALHGNGHGDGARGHSGRNVPEPTRLDDLTARTVQSRILLLIDLIYRLVLYGSVPAAVDATAALASGGSAGGTDTKKAEEAPKKREAPVDNRTEVERLLDGAAERPYEPPAGGAASFRAPARAARRTLRGGRTGGSLAALGAASDARGGGASGGGGGSGSGGGKSTASPAAAEETRRRQSRRKATLRRVHDVFWTSALPAATVLTAPAPTEDDAAVGAAVGHLPPLACLILSHHLLLARPRHSSSPAGHAGAPLVRGWDKGIAILGRLVDPGAGTPVVVAEGELHWGLAGVLGDGGSYGKEGGGATGKRARKSPKRDRSLMSEPSGASGRRASPRRASSRGSPARGAADASGPGRAKRARTGASLLERLASAGGAGGGASSDGAASSRGSASAAALLNDPFAISGRSAVEVLLGAAPSGAGAGARSGDGTLERLLARQAGLSAGLADLASGAGVDGRPGSSHTASSAGSPAIRRTLQRMPGGSLSGALAAPGESPRQHAEAMELADDGADTDDGDGEEHDEANEEEGEVGEHHDDEEDDDDDSEASVVDDEVVDVDGRRVDGGDDDDVAEEPDDDDSEAAEEREDDPAGQFDDAVIDLDELRAHHGAAGGGAGSPPHSSRGNNPHRASLARRTSAGGAGGSGGASPAVAAAKKRERERAYLRAAMAVLAAQHPELAPTLHPAAPPKIAPNNQRSLVAAPAVVPPGLLPPHAEESLLQSLCRIVRPPRKPLNLKLFLRRAPTQEEFFRGNLSRNPIGLSSLTAAGGASGSGGDGDRRSSGGGGGQDEPRISDLRRHIAKDLQMEDSAELLELLVADKILDVDLKVRVVQQVLWRRYVEENATSASAMGVAGAGPGHRMISTGGGLSMIFSGAGLGRSGARGTGTAGGARSSAADDAATVAHFPPMVVTYRLAGVDGEATEDAVGPDDLDDPEAPAAANSDPAAVERRLEAEFGITQLVAQDGGVAVLLASVRGTVDELLRRVRRDEVSRRRDGRGAADEATAADGNAARVQFAKAPPCPALALLRHCARLPANRKKMLECRAPTLLLRILLDILNAVNRSSGKSSSRKRSSTFDFASRADSMDVDAPGGGDPPAATRRAAHHVEGNPTTDALQEIIERLASDISAELSDEASSSSAAKTTVTASGSFVNLDRAAGAPAEGDEDRTLPLVLKSLHSTELSPPLRRVIAKLLPFLTYGRVSQSRELASYFLRYVTADRLGTAEDAADDAGQSNGAVLTNTFVEAAVNLPPVAVCENLRGELLRNGFVDKIRAFLLRDAPHRPPPWSPALYPAAAPKVAAPRRTELREAWRGYFARPGVGRALKVLTGLCARHARTQSLLADGASDEGRDGAPSLLTLCHWMEVTSDNTAEEIQNPDGILAETLLDALQEDNESTSAKIGALRKRTRERKKELAEERRNRALGGLRAFGTLTGSGGAASSAAAAPGGGGMFASMFSGLLAPAAGGDAAASASQPRTRRLAAAAAKKSAQAAPEKAKPAWMAEMEALDDEAGVTCAVCQEGRTLQPSELLGLYAYIKKVTIPASRGGGRGDVDGTALLLALPRTLPPSLRSGSGGAEKETLFRTARMAAEALEGSSHAATAVASGSHSISASGSGGGGRTHQYTTTVSAGNAIHCSCHKRARTADRNHPKAPKSEWEGASLRNSRVTCNVILPLVSSDASSVPLMAVETALAEHDAVVANALGGTPPRSALWARLHDVRLLLLRMAYGEALGADCGGGSSSSNFLLMLYQLYAADMFANNAAPDEPAAAAAHARGLPAGFIVGADIAEGPEFDRTEARSQRLAKGVADAAPMAALCSILFCNGNNGGGSPTKGKASSPPKRQWERHKASFLAGLLRCAGRRHTLGVTDSGCATSRGISAGRKNVEKARSFADWSGGAEDSSFGASSRSKAPRGATMIEEYAVALRPMITLYAVFDALSREFVVNNDDERTEASSERLAATLEACYKADGIEELLRVAEIDAGHDAICKAFEQGARTI
ncbi:hypothetical protein ACHAXT_000014 [Thalassiosira profunda]